MEGMIPKYGYCPECGELFKWYNDAYIKPLCPNKYHPLAWGRGLQPCWDIWAIKEWRRPPPKKVLLIRCKRCEHRFVCLTNGMYEKS